MKFLQVSFLIFTIFLGWLNSHPAPAVSRSYELGKLYQYQYSASVKLNEYSKVATDTGTSGKDVGFKILSDVEINPIWQSPSNAQEKLLRILLVTPKLHVSAVHKPGVTTAEHTSPLDSMTQNPLYAHWINGKVVKVFSPTEPTVLTNLKKAVASLLQFQTESGDGVEVDVSGICKVIYKVDGRQLKKTKHSCSHPKKDGQFSHPKKVLSVTTSSKSLSLIELLSSRNIVQSIKGSDELTMTANIWKTASVFATSDYKLTLLNDKGDQRNLQGQKVEDIITILSKELGQELIEQSVAAEPEQKYCTENCKSLLAIVEEYKKQLKSENLAKLQSSAAFLRLLEKFRTASKTEILEVLKKYNKIKPQILDVLAAAQTDAAFEAAVQVLDFTVDGKPDLPERFLLSLSTASHPTQVMIMDLLKLGNKAFKNRKLQETFLLTLGSLANTYMKIDQQNYKSKVIEEVLQFFSSKLTECKEEVCQLMHLRALANAAIPNSVPLFVEFVKKGGKTAEVALNGLHVLEKKLFSKEVHLLLEKVYHQVPKKHDSTTRIKAAEILTRTCEDNEILGRLINSLSEQYAPEVSSYMLSRLNTLVCNDNDIRENLVKLMKNHKIWNYYTAAQKGNSISLTKYMAQTDDVNITYGINMETVAGGVMKKSSFDVHIVNENDDLHLLSVGLFAGGISSLSGGGDAEEDSDEETTAGMELKVLDVGLRPYTFFVGTGDFMGLVWSGAGSDPTPAYQGNILVMDHTQHVPLHSGIVVELNVRGALSADLSGSISISLWNRNSHSLVKASGALMIQGSAKVETSVVRSKVEFSMGGESFVDFATDLDFYSSPFKMCLQMDQPDFSFRYNLRKLETVPGSQHLIRTLKKRTWTYPGKCYSFHQKNHDQCSLLLADN